MSLNRVVAHVSRYANLKNRMIHSASAVYLAMLLCIIGGCQVLQVVDQSPLYSQIGCRTLCCNSTDSRAAPNAKLLKASLLARDSGSIDREDKLLEVVQLKMRMVALIGQAEGRD